jgi:hypothetical protein
MIIPLDTKNRNFVGFKAIGKIDADDFKNIVIPQAEAFVANKGKLNYLLQIETDLNNFSFGAWLQDAILGIKVFTKWNRAAIVTDSDGIKRFTEFFSKIMIGEFKCFLHEEIETAIDWVSEEKTID